MDNFEWLQGYSHKYGMFAVNFSDPELKRTPKLSSVLYSQVCYKCNTKVTTNVMILLSAVFLMQKVNRARLFKTNDVVS